MRLTMQAQEVISMESFSTVAQPAATQCRDGFSSGVRAV
jgi:hypothetical protein